MSEQKNPFLALEGSNAYVPASQNPFSLETTVPGSMKYDTATAMLYLKKKIGDIDRYVQGKLRYKDKNEMYRCLAAEQIDAVALAIWNIENGDALIISDQTGIGKGRCAAAIIRYAVINKMPCVFVTKQASLFSAMYQDLLDIHTYPVPYVIASESEPEAKISIEVIDEESGTASIVYPHIKDKRFLPKGNDKVNAQLDGDTLPDGYDCVFTVYSQFSADNEAKTQQWKARGSRGKLIPNKENTQGKTEFLRRYLNGGILIIDESHLAGGADSITGFYVKDLLAISQGAVYLSATFAKDPKNMPLYGVKTIIKNAKLSDEELVKTFSHGGLALQEIVASDLVLGRQMIRRQRDYAGNMFSYDYMEAKYKEHAEVYDMVAKIMTDIVKFQKDFIKPFIKKISANVTSGTNEAGINNQEFVSTTHRLIGQLIFTIKAEDCAKAAIEMLNNNEKVVIAFSSTMESALKLMDLSPGETVLNSNFGIVLQRALDTVLTYQKKNIGGKNAKYYISFDDLSLDAQYTYNDIVAEIGNVSENLSISPIDVLINTIEAYKRPNAKIGGTTSPYYRVKECTGRQGRIAEVNGLPTYVAIKNNKVKNFAAFNQGEADVLLINKSASTGVSCHSSAKFLDKRRRVMLLVEPELDINEQVQKLGRIYRSGMLTVLDGKDNMPRYRYLSSSIPSEKRAFMILKKKLKSLDANTTGSQRNSESALEMEDFFNKYGAAIIKSYLLEENTEMLRLLGGKKSVFGGDEEEDEDGANMPTGEAIDLDTANENIVKRATNRVALLTVEKQEEFYNDVMTLYNEKIEALKNAGEYDLEVEYLNYQTETTGRKLFVQGYGGRTNFDKDAVLEYVTKNVLRKPYKWSEIEKLMTDNLDGMKPEALRDMTADKLKRNVNKSLTNYDIADEGALKSIQNNIDAAERKVEKAKEGDDENAIEKANTNLKNYQEKYFNRKIAGTNQRAGFVTTMNGIQACVSYFMIGSPIFIAGFAKGVIYKMEYTKDKSIATMGDNVRYEIALSDSRRTIKRTAKQLFTLGAMYDTTTQISLLTSFVKNWNANINTEGANANRTEGTIVTGNLLLAINKSNNDKSIISQRLIKFSKMDGGIKNGIEIKVEKGEAVTSTIPLKNATFDKNGHLFTTQNREIFLSKAYYSYYFQLPKFSDKTQDIIRDADIINTLKPSRYEDNGKFTEKGGAWVSEVKADSIDEIKAILTDKYGFTANGKTEDYQEPDTDNTEDYNEEAQSGQALYWYQIKGNYNAKDMPSNGFVEVVSDDEAGYDVVAYNRPLTPQEKAKNSLMPQFESAYYSALNFYNTIGADKVTSYIASLNNKQTAQYMLTNNPEEGNPEFYFGDYSPSELAKALKQVANMEDNENDLNLYIKQLKIAK